MDDFTPDKVEHVKQHPLVVKSSMATPQSHQRPGTPGQVHRPAFAGLGSAEGSGAAGPGGTMVITAM